MEAKSSLKINKETSWDTYEKHFLRDVEVKRGDICILSRKASVGPCFNNMAPYKGPSGITICLPKRSLKCVKQTSGISVNISRKGLGKAKSTANEIDMNKTEQTTITMEKQSEVVNNTEVLTNFFDNVKSRVSSMQGKIKNFFHS